MKSKIHFGTDGWRGRIADDFTFENVARIIQAFCDIFRERKDAPFVYLGYDRRFRSQDFAEHAASVLAANDIEVRLASQFAPTPCISWMTKQYRAGAGIVITASHNPYFWNGIKFKSPGGGAASPEYTAPIEERYREAIDKGESPQFMDLEEARRRQLLRPFDPMTEYIQQLRSLIDVTAIRKAAWRIICDPMYGTGTGFFSRVLEQKLKELHGDANPVFGFTQPEPIAKNLGELMDVVSQEGIDVGLATDGDADRIGAVDEQGNFVDSHHIFALILSHLVAHRGWKGEIVKTVSTSEMIDKLGKKYGLTVHQSAVGFRHISAKFKEIDPLIGGEESGGIAIAKHIPERDGILSGLLLLEIMTQAKKPLGEILRDLEKEIGPHRFCRQDLELASSTIQRVRSLLSDLTWDQLAGCAVRSINRIDGCRLNLEDGSWVLIRPSGTEPLLRLYAEADSPMRAQELLANTRQALKI